FHDLSAARLLHRYNLALAQGILLKAVRLTIDVRREQPARLRALIRRIKFHRLICKATATEGSCRLELDGPLSLFGATQKYGVQLASFLPALVPCRDFELTAEVLWGRERRSGAEQHWQRLRSFATAPFLLAVSDQLGLDDADEQLPAEIVRFRQMPLPDEIAARATALL